MQIHPTAVIEDGVQLQAGCVVHAHAIIRSRCELGEGVVVHPFAVLGGDPQDLRFEAGTPSGVRIGARTVIREHVTINRSTVRDACTQIGPDSFLMAACHVAHDCHIGERVVIANAVLLAGHVHVGDRAFLGGGAVVHQFCRIGQGVMVGGGARISQDVPPFCLATERNGLVGLNLVGLRRRGFSRKQVDELKRALRAVDATVGNPKELAAAALAGGKLETAEAQHFLSFFAGGRRGFVRTRRASDADDHAAGG